MKLRIILTPSLILKNLNPLRELPHPMNNNFEIEILFDSPVSLIPHIYMLLKLLSPIAATAAAQPIEVQSLI